MTDIIHAFFLGAAFVVGAFTGGLLCTLGHRKGRDELRAEISEHNKAVEKRLIGYVANTERIAVAAEMFVAMKDQDRRG